MQVRESRFVSAIELDLQRYDQQAGDHEQIQEMFHAVEVVGIVAVSEPSSIDKCLACLSM